MAKEDLKDLLRKAKKGLDTKAVEMEMKSRFMKKQLNKIKHSQLMVKLMISI